MIFEYLENYILLRNKTQNHFNILVFLNGT